MTISKNTQFLNKNKYNGIDALRFFSAMLVLVTHSTFYASERLGIENYLWKPGAKGVDIFFVISGFVMIMSSKNLMSRYNYWLIFIRKRLIRIVPLYWIATTLKLLILLIASKAVLHANLNWESILISYIFIPSINIDGEIKPFLGVGWTLVFEMFFYVVFSISLFLKLNVYKFVGVILFLFSLGSLVKSENSVFCYLMDPIVLEFYFGMIIAKNTMNDAKLDPRLALIFLLLSTYYILIPSNSINIPNIFNNGIPAAILVWSTVSLEKFISNKIPRFIVFMGNASYALYLFHPLVAPIAPEFMRKIGFINFTASVVFSIIIAIITSIIVHRWLEIPITFHLNKMQSPIKLDEGRSQP